MTTLLKHPQILFGALLRDGETVFLSRDGWSRNPRAARIARDSAEAAELSARGAADAAANLVVDVYLADVAIGPDGAPDPLHYREKFRLKGPSVRSDLGKQAASPASLDQSA